MPFRGALQARGSRPSSSWLRSISSYRTISKSADKVSPNVTEEIPNILRRRVLKIRGHPGQEVDRRSRPSIRLGFRFWFWGARGRCHRGFSDSPGGHIVAPLAVQLEL